MNPKKAVLIVFLFTAIAGLGLSAYTATSNIKVSVTGEKMNISPSTTTLSVTAGSYVTKSFTIESSSNITVKLKVIPADSNTVNAWGDEFVAVVSPEKVSVSSSHPAKVTLIAHSEKSGNYRVKLIAVK